MILWLDSDITQRAVRLGVTVGERKEASQNSRRKFFLISPIELKKKEEERAFYSFWDSVWSPLWNSTYFFTVQWVSSEKGVEKHFIDHKASEEPTFIILFFFFAACIP
jgi:hypothetical protein